MEYFKHDNNMNLYFRSLIIGHYGVKLQKKFQNAMSILSTEIYLDQIKHKDFFEDMLKC